MIYLFLIRALATITLQTWHMILQLLRKTIYRRWNDMTSNGKSNSKQQKQNKQTANQSNTESDQKKNMPCKQSLPTWYGDVPTALPGRWPGVGYSEKLMKYPDFYTWKKAFRLNWKPFSCWCPRRDLNPHTIPDSRFWVCRVCHSATPADVRKTPATKKILP